ncbi:MAG: hypothetical protein HN855_14380 [Anaerolineae bacterium]|jgi:hypothetical protein|nr:hypothetical protein [Anaerolineae bacterium]
MIDNLYLFSNNILNAILIAIAGALVAFVLGEIIIRLLRNMMGKAFALFVATLTRLIVLIW